jgi:hypothetical protein
MTNIVEFQPESVVIGMAVEVIFDPVTADITLPKFKPVSTQSEEALDNGPQDA